MIAQEIEGIMADVLSAKLPEMHIYPAYSTGDELGALAVVVEASPEVPWLRDENGKARGWVVEIAASVLGYTEDIKADFAAYRAACADVAEALRGLTDEELRAALPGAYSLSGYTESEVATDRGIEGNYDKWVAACALHIIATGQESGS